MTLYTEPLTSQQFLLWLRDKLAHNVSRNEPNGFVNDLWEINKQLSLVTDMPQPLRRTYTAPITKLPTNGVFVFGSNTEGRHGKGAAKTADTYFGAQYGQARGLQGSSYAIVTKDLTCNKHPSRSQQQITQEIATLYQFATAHPELDFYIAYNGNETSLFLCGWTTQELANMFAHSAPPSNIIFEHAFNTLVIQAL